ncbi:MAG: thioredoxin domain-containing protein [Ignavibacteriaceae bacterium]
MEKANRLINEKSPYLLQHAYNPVDWYAWGEEAFHKAKEDDKPVFLSIGYSTCHWCHVMEKESFEDEEVAGLMNDAFISIKVDREERPDIDGIYMTVCQMLTGSGGWPLTIILTPDKKPFFAGTYFSKYNRFGRSGLMDLIPKLKDVWLNRREDVLRSAREISATIAESVLISAEENIDEDISSRAFNEFSKRYDNVFGGFNNAPKFPTPHNFYFLLRYWKRTGNKEALEMVEKTLIEMRKGGIYDHIGFGFHRYSTDQHWLVPHFEKMLYDQALLSSAYTEAYLATKNNLYKNTAEEILEYILRDMTSPEGGFYSAEDADSEGVEGKFYLWTENELSEILGEDAGFFIQVFNTTNDGNWIDPVHGSRDKTNILHLKKSHDELADDLNLQLNELDNTINKLRTILFNRRERRIHPYKDDKILTDWNGLMISAFARAAQAFSEEKYTNAAEKAAAFILDKLRDKNGRLLHRYRSGEAGINAHADDYSFFIAALIDLYETNFNPQYLETALELNEDFIKHFWDEKNHGFFFTADDGEELIVRQKEIYDGAVPSANSIAILNLVRLSRLTGNIRFEEMANEILNAFAKNINTSPSAFSQALAAVDYISGSSYEIIVTGDKNSPETVKILKYLRSIFLPNKVILQKDNNMEQQLNKLSPFTSDYKAKDGKTLVYVCRNFSCSLPVESINELERLLSN